MNSVPESLVETIIGAHHALFQRYDPDRCIALLDMVPSERPYHFLPPEVKQLWALIEEEFGADGFDAFQRLTLLRLANRFEARREGRQYTREVLERFSISLKRIVASVADTGFEHYRSVNDILLKDLGLCRQKIFPAGALIVAPDSGFHRAMLYRAGIVQAGRFAWLLLTTGGHRHWYQVHLHSSELDDFNPEGRNRSYLRIADMLELNPGVRGVWGGSWYYDPAIATISPRLAYLRRLPQDNGAYFFFSKIDVNSGALSKSETRRKAHARGDYVPKVYAMLWPRRRLLAWAAAMRQRGVS